MLGRDVMAAGHAHGHEMAGFDLPELDITDPASLAASLPQTEAVVNCAAYTRVDDAEKERGTAFAVNGRAAGHVARLGAERGWLLLHLSTDYVFDGSSQRPYREEDTPRPLNVYGASKLAGEEAVRATRARSLVVRVQSLFGRHGRHFVKAIAEKLREGTQDLAVVDDQISSPTYTRHLAGALIELACEHRTGTVHVAASGTCSWFEFARAIARHLRPDATIRPVPSSAYPRPARRPARSVLDTSRFRRWTGRPLPTWQQGLAEYLAEEEKAP
jgi:dTDP-4-dehydrorhamnose reductase